jgi:hypothetical protein
MVSGKESRVRFSHDIVVLLNHLLQQGLMKSSLVRVKYVSWVSPDQRLDKPGYLWYYFEFPAVTAE